MGGAPVEIQYEDDNFRCLWQRDGNVLQILAIKNISEAQHSTLTPNLTPFETRCMETYDKLWNWEMAESLVNERF